MKLFLSIVMTMGVNALAFTYPSRLVSNMIKIQSINQFSTSTQQCSTKKYKMSVSDDESDLMIEAKLLDNQIILSLSELGSDAFDFSTENMLTKDALQLWEKQVDTLGGELAQLTNKAVLLAVYGAILKKAAIKTLDPLQMATFQIFSNAIMDALVKMHPPTEPITSLIDEVTDVHLNFVDRFQPLIDDGGDEGYSQSARQEYLAYQLAGLVKRSYSRVSRGLGKSFDMSASTQDMRINNWVSPVFARLERRIVRFTAGNVEDKEVEINSSAFIKLMDKIKLEVTPRYSVSGENVRAVRLKFEEGSSSSSDAPLYPPWELANFVTKLMRNIVVAVEVKGLESKVNLAFKNLISDRMRSLGKPLEKIYESKQSVLTSKGTKQVEDMLNLGHLAVASVFTLWQMRYNIVGVPNAEGTFIKDYLRPVSLTSEGGALESIPKILRDEVGFIVEDFSETLGPSEELGAVSIVGHAVRATACDEMRSLITYNSDESDWPVSRDAAYITVLSSVLTDALSAPIFNLAVLHENAIALVALEEIMGVREPRLACTKGYQVALRNTVSKLINGEDTPEGLWERVEEVEIMLGMVLRLPEKAGKKARMDAFRESVDKIIENADERGMSGFKEVDELYPKIAEMLDIDMDQAEAYVAPLGQTKFDKSVGSILMNADLAVSMPEMGEMFRSQIKELAENVMMSQDEGDQRTVFLAAAVFESLMETALEENRRMNNERTEAMLLKAYNMYRHPLLISLQHQAIENAKSDTVASADGIQLFKGDLVEMGVKMTVARLGTSLVMELMRLLETSRGRLSSGPDANTPVQGWGTAQTTQADPKFIAFISSVQGSFLKEYAAGSLKRGYTKQ